VLCGVTANSRIIETDNGYAVIEPATSKPKEGVLLILCDGRTQFAKLMGASLITDDGEAIEGAALEEVEVLGRVTFFINRTSDDGCPVM
jgi:vacuolar-type H+-ATPase subunit B/Vma2